MVFDPPLPCCAREEEGSGQIDVNHALEVLERVVFCWCAASDPSVGDEDVDCAELLDDLVPSRLYTFFGRSVALVTMHLWRR